MLKVIVNGRNIDLTDAIKGQVHEKLERLEHHYDFIQEIHVFLSVDKNPRIKDNQHAEATVHVKGAVVRVEVKTDNLYASIDKLVDKIDRSLRKHKTKLLGRAKSAKEGESIRKSGFEEAVAAESLEEEDVEGVYLTFTDEEEEEAAAANQ
jgi:putative sigma-54 modulation protein